MPITGAGVAGFDPVAPLVTALNAAATALAGATSSSLQKANNLSDLTSASAARTSLGLTAIYGPGGTAGNIDGPTAQGIALVQALIFGA